MQFIARHLIPIYWWIIQVVSSCFRFSVLRPCLEFERMDEWFNDSMNGARESHWNCTHSSCWWRDAMKRISKKIKKISPLWIKWAAEPQWDGTGTAMGWNRNRTGITPELLNRGPRPWLMFNADVVDFVQVKNLCHLICGGTCWPSKPFTTELVSRCGWFCWIRWSFVQFYWLDGRTWI